MKVNCCKCGKIMDSDEMFCGECGCKYFIINTETYEAEKCPLILIEHKLFELDGNVKLESLFLNESDKTIAACKVVIKCFDQFGDAVEDTTAKYMDLSIGTYETFGETKIIDLKSNETRKVELKVDKIIFDDGTSWECNDDFKFILANKNKYEKYINKLENQRMQTEEKINSSKKYYDLLALKNKWGEILYKLENEIGSYSGNEDYEDNVLECLRSSNDGVGLVEQYFNELTTILGGNLNIFIPEEINSLETNLFDLYFESDNETETYFDCQKNNNGILKAFFEVVDELKLHFPVVTYVLHNGITYVGNVFRNNRVLFWSNFFWRNTIHFNDIFYKNRINNLPPNIINIESKSFSGIDIINFSKMPEDLENIGDHAFSESYFYNNGDEVDVVELPSSLKRIGAYAFYKSSIKTIIINSDIVFESGSLSGVDNLIFNIEIKECKNFEFDGRYLYSLTGKNKLLIWYKGGPEEDTFYLNDVNDVIDYDPEIDSKYIKYLVIEKSENEEVQYGDILGDFKNLIAVYIKNNVILYSDDDYDIPEYDEDYYDSIDEWKEDVEYNKKCRNPTLYLIEKMNIRLFYEKDISIEEMKKICEKDIQLENIICKEYTDKESIEKKINDTKKEIVEIDDLLYKYQSELVKNEVEMSTFNTKLRQLQKEIQRLHDEKAYNNNYINLFNKSKVERKNSIIDEQIVANNQEIGFVRSELEKKNRIIMEMRNRFNVEIENLKYNKKDKEFELQVLNRVWYRLYDK